MDAFSSIRSGVKGMGPRRLSVATTTAERVVDDTRSAGCVESCACVMRADLACPLASVTGTERPALC